MNQQIRSRSAHIRSWAVFIVLGACSTACDRSSGPPLHTVRGRVFVGEQPATGALVVFSRVADPSGRAVRPRGYVNDVGEFQLTTRMLNDGAPAGTYTVAVIWREQEDEDDEPGRYLAPVKYANPKTSGLLVEIRSGDNELEPFVLSAR